MQNHGRYNMQTAYSTHIPCRHNPTLYEPNQQNIEIGDTMHDETTRSQIKTNICHVHFEYSPFRTSSSIAYTSLDFGHKTRYGVDKRVTHKPY